MAKCKICGNETRKGRQECIGCRNLKKAMMKKGKASATEFEKAKKHLLKNPKLTIISWFKFGK